MTERQPQFGGEQEPQTAAEKELATHIAWVANLRKIYEMPKAQRQEFRLGTNRSEALV